MQLWLHRFGEIVVPGWSPDSSHMLTQTLRCIHGSHERSRRHLHIDVGLRLHMPANMQCRLYRVWHIFVFGWHAHRGNM